MIYLVTASQELFTSDVYQIITIEESLELLNKCETLQFDTETTGLNPQLCTVMCAQFGSKKYDMQIVVDTQTVNLLRYKEILETKVLVGQNLKFDISFLYNYGIIPTIVYDTMIVEQLLCLGFPFISVTKEYYEKYNFNFPYLEVKDTYNLSFSLKAIAARRLNIDIDKTVRGQIMWRGLDSEVIQYAANDVVYLEDIMALQIEDCRAKKCLVAAKLECDFIPSLAYMEWCGVKLDATKWKAKMFNDQLLLNQALKNLNDYAISLPVLSKYVTVNLQGSLFDGFDTEPQIDINWASSKQVVPLVKKLGFDTTVNDKKTGEDKDSVIEKHLKGQKGIDDEFLKLYFDYQEHFKVVSSFGQGHLNQINPKTGRLHTTFKQLGASSGRLSCGSNQYNTALAKLKGLPPKEVTYANLQQLPANVETRSCFVAEEGNLFCSADYSSEEARLAGDIYQDEAIIKMFKEGIDSHSMYAKIFFKEELKDIDVRDIKKLRPDLRQKSKGPEFALNFGGGVHAIMQAIQCTEEVAQTITKNYEEGFVGTTAFAKEGSKFTRKNGYVLINPITGHKMYWWDHDVWLERQKKFTQAFWQDYRDNHKGTNDEVAQEVRMHFQAASKYDRMVRNSPTQGTAAIILKEACINLFKWIVDNNQFNKVKICVLVHDEINIEFPETLTDCPTVLKQIMEDAADKYCKSLPIPATLSIEKYWKH